jgi:hypothetical protein
MGNLLIPIDLHDFEIRLAGGVVGIHAKSSGARGRARPSLPPVAASKLALVKRAGVHAFGSVPVSSRMFTAEHHPAGSRAPGRLQDIPSPDRSCKCPAGASQASAPRPGTPCRTGDCTNPDDCDPQLMWPPFVAQRWHSPLHFVAPRQHSVNNRRASAGAAFAIATTIASMFHRKQHLLAAALA